MCEKRRNAQKRFSSRDSRRGISDFFFMTINLSEFILNPLHTPRKNVLKLLLGVIAAERRRPTKFQGLIRQQEEDQKSQKVSIKRGIIISWWSTFWPCRIKDYNGSDAIRISLFFFSEGKCNQWPKNFNQYRSPANCRRRNFFILQTSKNA